jgi:hypothetical protein
LSDDVRNRESCSKSAAQPEEMREKRKGVEEGSVDRKKRENAKRSGVQPSGAAASLISG